MANHLAIATVTEALRLRLTAAIEPAVPGVEVVTRRPEATDGQAHPQVTAFLFRVARNAALANMDLPTRGAQGTDVLRRPRAALELHYLLTFSGAEDVHVPQRMLGLAVASLHAHPALTATELAAAGQGEPVLAASDLTADEPVRFCPAELSLDDLSKLWLTLGQVPYRLSTVYGAGGVLIDSDVATREPLPVRSRGLAAVPGRAPVVERVRTGTDVPLELELVGRNLRGPSTAVTVDGGPPRSVDTATATRVTVAVGDVPAGVHGIQVVHTLDLGEPPVPHRAVESAVAAFVIRPAVVVALADAGATLVVTFTPPLAADQRVALLLSEYLDPAPADRPPGFHRLEPDAPPAAGAMTLRFARGGVPAGAYLVRAQVDGAESLLDVVDGAPVPRVVLP